MPAFVCPGIRAAMLGWARRDGANRLAGEDLSAAESSAKVTARPSILLAVDPGSTAVLALPTGGVHP